MSTHQPLTRALINLRVLPANLRKRLSRFSPSTRRALLIALLLIFLSLLLLTLTPSNIPTLPTDAFFDENLFRDARTKWPSRNVTGNLEDELWNQVKHHVVFGIKTGHEVARDRLAKLKHTGWWSVGRDVPNVIAVGDAHDLNLGVIGVKTYARHLLTRADNYNHSKLQPHHHVNNTSDIPSHWFDKSGWKGDKDKNLPALHLMYTAFPGKKWYILLDDDTYIFLENFARYILQEGMDQTPVYTGKVFYISRCGGFERDGTFKQNKSQPKGMFAHGGSGIIINQKAMEVLYPRIGSCIRSYSSCWAGDMQVGLCLREGGVLVRPQAAKRPFDPHFIPFWPSKALSDRRYSKRWKSEAEPITFHKIPDHEQQLMSDFERAAIDRGDTVNYSELRVHLMSHGIVPCHTEHNKKTKYYSTEFMPPELK